MSEDRSSAVMGALPPPEAWPTVDEVAALLRARTKTTVTGVEAGTFLPASDDPEVPQTRPTAEGAGEIIANAAQAVADELAADVPAALYGSFSFATKLYAVCLIEKAYFPEQINSARSAYEQYWTEYQRAVQALKDRLPDADGTLQASGIGVLGLRRPRADGCCLSELGSPPQFPDLRCATVNYDDPWC